MKQYMRASFLCSLALAVCTQTLFCAAQELLDSPSTQNGPLTLEDILRLTCKDLGLFEFLLDLPHEVFHLVLTENASDEVLEEIYRLIAKNDSYRIENSKTEHATLKSVISENLSSHQLLLCMILDHLYRMWDNTPIFKNAPWNDSPSEWTRPGIPNPFYTCPASITSCLLSPHLTTLDFTSGNKKSTHALFCKVHRWVNDVLESFMAIPIGYNCTLCMIVIHDYDIKNDPLVLSNTGDRCPAYLTAYVLCRKPYHLRAKVTKPNTHWLIKSHKNVREYPWTC